MIKLNTQQKRKERKTKEKICMQRMWICFMKEQKHRKSVRSVKQPKEKFIEQGEDPTWAAEHVVGVASDVPEDIKKTRRANF